MADYFSSMPNFVNPDYATPGQIEQARKYAEYLNTKGQIPVKSWQAGAANALNSALAGWTLGQASAADAANYHRQEDAATRLAQPGAQPNPRDIAVMLSSPWASPQAKDYAKTLIEPKAVEDVYGRPGYASPNQGVQAAPVQGNFQPGFRAPEAAPGVSTVSPIPAPGGRAPVASPQAAGGPPVTPRLDALAAKGREYQAASNVTQAGSVAQGDVIKEDIGQANEASNVLKGVGIIRDNIQRYGDKITFGPTSEWSLEMKRAAANYAPGMMRDQLNAIAAADSINKVGISLAGTLSKQIGSGTQGEFYKSLQGVPGLLTSKEGALAMADMVQQAAQKQQQLGLILQNQANWQNYAAIKQQFWRNNPVINPLTGNPIELDATNAAHGSSQPSGGARILSVRPAQ